MWDLGDTHVCEVCAQSIEGSSASHINWFKRKNKEKKRVFCSLAESLLCKLYNVLPRLTLWSVLVSCWFFYNLEDPGSMSDLSVVYHSGTLAFSCPWDSILENGRNIKHISNAMYMSFIGLLWCGF